MRLIDADAFKEYMRKALEETRGCYPDKGEWAEAITEQFCKDIDDQPTVEPERKKGKWIPQNHNKTNGIVSTAVYYYPKCSVCGHCANYTNFCPNCGAKMDGSE